MSNERNHATQTHVLTGAIVLLGVAVLYLLYRQQQAVTTSAATANLNQTNQDLLNTYLQERGQLF